MTKFVHKNIEFVLAGFIVGIMVVCLSAAYVCISIFEDAQVQQQMRLKTTPADVHRLVSKVEGMVEQLQARVDEEFHLRDILDAGEIGVVEADPDTRQITYWDGVASSIWGYTKEEALGLKVEDLMDIEAARGHTEWFQDGVNNPKGEGIPRLCDQALHKDGYLFDVHLNLRVSPERRVTALVQLPK